VTEAVTLVDIYSSVISLHGMSGTNFYGSTSARTVNVLTSC